MKIVAAATTLLGFETQTHQTHSLLSMLPEVLRALPRACIHAIADPFVRPLNTYEMLCVDPQPLKPIRCNKLIATYPQLSSQEFEKYFNALKIAQPDQYLEVCCIDPDSSATLSRRFATKTFTPPLDHPAFSPKPDIQKNIVLISHFFTKIIQSLIQIQNHYEQVALEQSLNPVSRFADELDNFDINTLDHIKHKYQLYLSDNYSLDDDINRFVVWINETIQRTRHLQQAILHCAPTPMNVFLLKNLLLDLSESIMHVSPHTLKNTLFPHLYIACSRDASTAVHLIVEPLIHKLIDPFISPVLVF